MARTLKKGLNYFPIEVAPQEKIELLEAKHGLIGFAIIIKLKQKIFSNGYYIKWVEENILLFKKSINVEKDKIKEIIDDAVEFNIFSKELYTKFSILTSKDIQENYIEATQRRHEVEFIEEYLLVDKISKKYKDNMNVNIIRINVNINKENVDINSQKRRDEKKREEILANNYEEETLKPPTLDEVKAFAIASNSSLDYVKFFNYFNSRNWLDSKNQPVHNWKGKFVSWEKHEKTNKPILTNQPNSKYKRSSAC